MFGKQKVKTQTMIYEKNDTKVYITFKRAGNVVECFVTAHIATGVQGTFSGSNCKGEVPNWAYPDNRFGKVQHFYDSNNNHNIFGFLQIGLFENGNVTGLYQNTHNTSENTLIQFTYIVDDSNEEYELGDVDGNGTIDEVDLNLIKGHINNEVYLSKKQIKAADMNKDESVTSSDYVLLQKKLGLV